MAEVYKAMLSLGYVRYTSFWKDLSEEDNILLYYMQSHTELLTQIYFYTPIFPIMQW